MYAVEALIERLEEQKALAPGLQENPAAGGKVEQMCDRLREGMNSARHIPALKAVEAGHRRYGKFLANALAQVEKLTPILTKAEKVAGAAYADGLQRDKAMSQFKDTPKEVVRICDAAIGELRAALKVLDEGENKQTKLAAATA